MGKHREFKKVGAMIGLLVATCFVGAVGCRDDKGANSSPEDTQPGVTKSTKSEPKPPPLIGVGPPIRSENGKYEAIRLSDGKGGEHYRVIRAGDRKAVVTTDSKYSDTPNDAKAGRFSPNSTKFATAYHYGDEEGQKYTWIGVWSLETAERVAEFELEHVHSSSIPDSVFEERGADQAKETEHWDLHSPDGKYGATTISHQGGVHFKLGEIEGGRVVFITHGQFSTPNDVKTGRFSSDSTKFAASYHYGHAGNYTWVGIWSLKTEKLIRGVRLDDWMDTIPNSVFDEDEES